MRLGWDYLVDPYLGNLPVTKFSGTAQAGRNNDSKVGKTIDAFAHFSLTVTGGNLVLVDLQGSLVLFVSILSTEQILMLHLSGILSPVYIHGMWEVNDKLTLFDTMSHM